MAVELSGSFPHFVTSELCQTCKISKYLYKYLKISVEFAALHLPAGKVELLICRDDYRLFLCRREAVGQEQPFAAASFSKIMYPSAGSTAV